MNTDYNKKRYLELLDQRSIGDNSNNDELLRYSCMLTNQLDWETRDQYLSLMEKFLNGNISMPEFFAELHTKNYAIIDAVVFLEKHRILLSLDKKASKFGELLEDVMDELEGDLSYTGDEFKNFIEENFILITQTLCSVTFLAFLVNSKLGPIIGINSAALDVNLIIILSVIK